MCDCIKVMEELRDKFREFEDQNRESWYTDALPDDRTSYYSWMERRVAVEAAIEVLKKECPCIKKLESKLEKFKGLEEMWLKQWRKDGTASSRDSYYTWMNRRMGAQSALEALQAP